MLNGCNPMLLTHSSEALYAGKARIDALKARVEAGEGGDLNLSPEENLELWKLKEAVDGGINAAGEIVPPPFRMSGYLPFNGPISVAMIACTSTSGLLFWAWVNQSQNAMVNYYNRGSGAAEVSIDAEWIKPHHVTQLFHQIDTDHSGKLTRNEIQELITGITGEAMGDSDLDSAMDRLDPNRDGKVTLEEFRVWFDVFKHEKETLAATLRERAEQAVMAQSYGTAVGLSLGVSFVLAFAIKKKFPVEKANQILKFVAFPASVAASSMNCYIVRKPEIPAGFPLMDGEGKAVLEGETSSAAAAKAPDRPSSSAPLLID